MISDELLSKFDSIEELPVSEEMLGAFEEGHLNPYERLCIEAKIEDNPLIERLVNAAREGDLMLNDIYDIDNSSLENGLLNLSDFSLPELPEINSVFHEINSDIANLYIDGDVESLSVSDASMSVDDRIFSAISSTENFFSPIDSFTCESESLPIDNPCDGESNEDLTTHFDL